MSKIVQGKDCVVFKWNVSLSVWVPYACARSSTITITTDVLETSITGSGKYRTFLPVANSFTGSIEGLMQLMKTNTVSIADLIALQLAHTVLLMRFVNENEEGDIFTMEANFYLTSSGITSSFDNVNTFSCELKGTGPLTLIYTPTPVISGRMNRKEFTLPLSDDSIVITELMLQTLSV
jgi:predicted secreted protein